MMSLIQLSSFLVLWICTVTADRPYPYPPEFDAEHYPFPYLNGKSPCYDYANPPEILSFHVHSVFDGTNRTKAQFAVNLRAAFMKHIEKIDPSFTELCPFSHMNPAGFMKKMCSFPFEETMDDFPFWTDDLIWSTTNFAFFVPKEYLLETEMWWRQHNDASLASFAFHVNTGCEDNSHTIWTTVNEGYAFKTNASGLLCCRSGPAACYCDMVSYTLSDGKCLIGNYVNHTGTVEVKECNATTSPGLALWKETHYNQDFIQIENAGAGETNSYTCLGQEGGKGKEDTICKRGSKIKMIPCYERDNRLNLFNWIDGKIKATGCGRDRDLCVHYDGTELVLENCSKATNITRA